VKVRFAAAGLDLDKSIVLVGPRGAQAKCGLVSLPQPRQPGGGLGLKCFPACYDDDALVTALEIPNDFPAPRLGELKKLAVSNSDSLTSTSTWPKAVPLDEESVALCCFLTAAFAASRRPPAV
jgi:hypothetical protein